MFELLLVFVFVLFAIHSGESAALVIGTATAIYVAPVAVETVAVVAPVVAATGPVGWIIGGGILLVVGLFGFFAWLFGSNSQNSQNVRYVNGNRHTTTAAVYSISEQQKRKLIKNALKISSFHVSCKSDHPSKEKVAKSKWNAIGIVLFEYGGKGDFFINHIHCKSGYIVLKTDKNLSPNGETYHAACFEKVFGKSHKKLAKTLVGGGFSVQNGECAFNSGTFNCGDGADDRYHFGTRTMNPLIQHHIELAVKNWIENFKQNTYVKDAGNKIKNTLCVHPDSPLANKN